MDPRDPIVTLNVKNSAGGTDGLYVHQGVLCKSSKFFQTAMKKEWAGLKDEPHVIDLPEDCTETVKMYIEWLYTGKISSKLCMTMEECNFDDKNFSREAEKNFIVLAKAHIYGKKIIDSVFTRQMFNEMRETLFCYMRWPTADSLLRRIIASKLAYHLEEKDELDAGLLDVLDKYPHQALVDTLKAIARPCRQP
ncbi:hypothetical protein COCMIDRAFT_33280 [Bipolaris oryzae ATCC 44560]|uniref:BTB domain-containing protein n=1 Tax=Bipolaris oryzae ATCC 44560 TaxID=930090 RepID=W6ZZR9_COCMI|nr:uncharacterized protein COCMIDRAFT_33280 [Bipolaris oryzae ATCC 44560]EUC49221.1 hypothetical protein COCMIDRAFT_33280 [Bipolaris oryzae ATCC 44560]